MIEHHVSADLSRGRNPVPIEQDAGLVLDSAWRFWRSLLPLSGFDPGIIVCAFLAVACSCTVFH